MLGLSTIAAIVVGAASATLTSSINLMQQLGADPQTPSIILDLMPMGRMAYALLPNSNAYRQRCG